jgi:hypothetical protein
MRGAALGGAAACASTPLSTGGGVWHKTPREQGFIPKSSIDTEAGGSKSGWHGWWYGWKLHLALTVRAIWIPLAEELTVADRSDNEVAPLVLSTCQAKYAMCWVTRMTTTPSCGISATGEAVSWSPPAEAPIPIVMAVWRCGKSSYTAVASH